MDATNIRTDRAQDLGHPYPGSDDSTKEEIAPLPSVIAAAHQKLM